MSNLQKTSLVVLITVLVTIVILAIPFYFLFVRDVEQLEQQNELLQAKLSGEGDVIALPDVKEQSELPLGPKLVKNTEAGEELVFLFGNEYDTIVKWNNWLFVGDVNYGQIGKTAEVRAYNIQTGEAKTLFKLSEAKEFEGETMQYINSISVLDKYLFVTLGGYMLDGGVYYMELNDVLNNNLLFVGKARNPIVSKSSDRYIVVGGEGDAGWSQTEIYLIAQDFKSLNKVLEVGGTEGDGQHILYHEDASFVYIIGETKPVKQDSSEWNYVQVFIQDIVNSQGVGSLINDALMPAGIKQIRAYKDKMFLVGEDLYQFTYSNQKLEKIMALPARAQYAPYSAKAFYGIYEYDAVNDKLCFDQNYQLDLKTKVFTELSDKCWGFDSPSTPGLITTIPALGLPDNFYYKN